MTPAELSRTVLGAVRRAVEEGALPGPVPERVKVERSRPGGSGDYATSIALRLAGPAGRQARDVAEVLKARITDSPGIARVEITGPGFLNFTLGDDSAGALVRAVREQGTRYGYGDGLAGNRVRFEPVGELRARVITDTVVRLLIAQGADAAVAPGGEERITAVPAHDDGPGHEKHDGPHNDGADDGLFARVGRDAALWALLRPAAHDRPLPGDGLLVQNEGNALFRVRYAHARSRALLRNAADLGVTARIAPGTDGIGPATAGPDAATAPATSAETAPATSAETVPPTAAPASVLLTVLGDHPAVIESAARLRAPDRVARHLEATADAFLGFQHTVLPMGDEKPSATHRSRLALAEAAGTVLAGGLALLGISAPEHL
ncbi:DALR anticodon-binding domain-containing protein [Streptomyces sp. NBC_01619]|uniref:ArgS-related anticodon-binding protein NrtL n=1 Tax=Streptomyces sp. NBC_01619 TaxID=2975901 RepID=UPI00224E1F55|nr:DALR anticodon-binding domain-containing protein [Streptomyces sp. NBC_01619]MCX4513298.1 DALR anticodon-binding domain-containing protein [Streptomyces sp. NBC_01619]